MPKGFLLELYVDLEIIPGWHLLALWLFIGFLRLRKKSFLIRAHP